MADRIQDLGVFTAYGEAREAGYEGSKAEFELGLKKSAEYAENAQASADAAAASADDAELSAAGAAESAEDAETSAGEATQSATDAAASAVAAAGSANAASASATQAASNAQAALGDIAPIFEDTKPYSVGDYVIYTDGKLYRFTDAHTAGAWVGTDVTAVVIGQDVSELKSDFTELKPRVDSLEINKADVITSFASGSIASFSDGADDMPVKELNIAIEPVQAGSGDPSLDNVRSISGWTSAKVTRTGKNLYDLSKQVLTLNNSHLAVVLKPNTDYVFSVDAIITGLYALYSDAETQPDTTNDSDWTNIAFIYNNTALSFNSGSHKWYKLMTYEQKGIQSRTYQLELGSTATAYESYQGETYDITFPSEAGTVYGGTLDMTSGVLTVDRAMVDMGTLTYNKASIPNNRWRFVAAVSDISMTPANEKANIVCSAYKTITANNTYEGVTGISNNVTQHNIIVCDMTYSDVADFKSAISGVQCVYPLDTPQTYQLTPTEVSTLLGQNNIWADTGDISVTYKADTKLYIDKKFAGLQALILEN